MWRRGSCAIAVAVAVAACDDPTATVIDAAKSSFYVDETSPVAGDVVHVTIRAVGPDGVAVEGISVMLVASGADNELVQPPPTDASGYARTTWSSTKAEPKLLTAYVGGSLLGVRDVTFVAGAPAQLAFLDLPVTAIAGRRFSTTVGVQDVYGNLTDETARTVSVQLVDNPSSAVLYGTLDRPAADGAAKFSDLAIRAVGSFVLRATAMGVSAVDSPPLEIIYGDASISTLTLTPARVPADGVTPVTITLHATNMYGVTMVGQSVQLVATGTGNLVTPAAGVTDSAGNFTASWTSTTVGYKTMTATVGGVTLTKQAAFARAPCALHWPGAARTFGAAARSGFALADLDGDGRRELIEASGGFFGSIFVRRGTTEGFEPAPAYYQLPSPLGALTTGDVNGDGRIDVLVAAESAGEVMVLLGTSQGLAAPLSVSLAAAASSIVLADVDLDGRLDLAAALPSTNRIDIHTGAGDGTFGAAIATLATGAGASRLEVVDLDNNTRPDLVVQNTTDATMSAFVATGNATFGAPVVTGDSGSPVFADVDHDNLADVVLVTTNADVRVRLGDGAGGFTLADTFATGLSAPPAVAVADFTGDTHVDIALPGASRFVVLAGAGTGNFSLAGTYLSDHPDAGGRNGGALAVDVDMDGWVDVVDVSWAVGTVHNAGNGRFALPIIAAPERVLLEQAGDFNGDGRADLFAHHGTTSAAATLLGTPTGALSRVGLTTSVADSTRGAVGDVDEDGHLDVVLFEAGIEILLGDGGGGFTAGPPSTLAAFTDAVLADVNNDAHLDLVMIGDPTHGLAIALGTGQATFATPSLTFLSSVPLDVTVADIDHDGYVDPIVATQTAILVFRSTGSGTLSPYPQSYASFNASISAIAVADFDYDGNHDIAYASKTSSTDTFVTIRVLKGSPNGAFTLASASYTIYATRIHGMRTADLDATATEDLVLDTARGIMVLQGNVDGTFAEARTLAAGGDNGVTPGTPFALGDVNGDGRLDLAISSAAGMAIAPQGACTP